MSLFPCSYCLSICSFLVSLPRRSTLFPYTTLFRSRCAAAWPDEAGREGSRDAGVCGGGDLHPGVDDGHRGGHCRAERLGEDRKSTRLNSSHLGISYAVFCLKKKNRQ